VRATVFKTACLYPFGYPGRSRKRSSAPAGGKALRVVAGYGDPMPDEGEIHVRVQPRARCDEVVGERDGRVVVRVTAPPVDGKANVALCRLVARAAGVPPSAVEVVRGHTSRDKTVRVRGVDVGVVRAALGVE
jgi:uncharacterized protein (TIGR00251 family)